MTEKDIPRFNRSGLSYPGEKRRIAVIGLGNILFSDEGVGVHAAAELSRRFTFSPVIDIVDGGTLGLDLLPFFQDRDRILIIDAVDFVKSPGYMACLQRDKIRSVLNPKLSVHHIGLSDLLFAAQLTRTQPLDLCLVGIQPQSLALGMRMTNAIGQAVGTLVEMAVNKLEEWNVIACKITEPSCSASAEKYLPILPPAVFKI